MVMAECKLGDCFEKLQGITDGSIDLLVTDPPYRFKRSNGGGLFSTIDGSEEKNNPYARKATNGMKKLASLDSVTFDAKRFLEAVRPKLKKFYGYFFCNKELVHEYLDFAIRNGYLYDILVMYKSNPIPARNNHFLPDLEYCVMMREGGTYFSKDCDFDDYRKAYEVSTSGKRLHPAQKPVGFLERMVRVSCPKDGIVLDPFMGSGSTGVAAIRNGRNFIGIEKDEQVFKLGSERVMSILKDGNTLGPLFEQDMP